MCFLELLVNVEQDLAQIERTHANSACRPTHVHRGEELKEQMQHV